MLSDDDQKIQNIVRELKEPVRVSASLDDRIMRAVRELPRHARSTLWARLTTPRRVTIMPLSWGLLAASLAALAALGAAHVSQDVHTAAAMDVEIDEAGRNHELGGIDPDRLRRNVDVSWGSGCGDRSAGDEEPTRREFF